MKSISLKNFKSYDNQTVKDLNPKINVILGMNGQGKSNLLKAISFLFTDKFTINKNQLLKILYRGVQPNNSQIQVEVSFTQKLSGQNFKISKNWKNGSIQDLRVNQKFKTKTQFENFIESFGLAYSNPYNIVQQGKVTEIALMDEFQLYKLLQQATGIRKFRKRFETATSDILRIVNEQTQIKQILDDTKVKLIAVQDKKNQFQYFALQQKTRGIKNKRALINSLQNLRKNLAQSKQNFANCSKDIDQNRLKIKEIHFDLSQIQNLHKVTEDKINFFQSEEDFEDKINLNVSAIDSQNDFEVNKYRQKEMSKKQIKKELANKQAELKDLAKAIQNDFLTMMKSRDEAGLLQKNLQTYRQKYEMIKSDFDIENGDKNKTKVKQNLQGQISTDQQNIKNIQSQIQKLDKFLKQLQKPSNTSKDEIQVKQLTGQSQRLAQLTRQNKIKLIQTGRKKMNIQCQLQTINNRKKYFEDILRKILPNVDYNLLNTLKKQNVKGVHGYLLDFININQDVRFAYELAGLNKLCTLLVQNEDVASQVIEINKKIKGKQVNILPLSFLTNQLKQKRSYPSSDKAHSLLNKDWISINQSLNLSKQFTQAANKIINNTFAKYMLVQDYSTGLLISKQYHLNCITSESQIVYADAFMCKVGREQHHQNSRIQVFFSHKSLVFQEDAKVNQLKKVQKIMNQLQNEEILLFGKFNSCEMKKKHLNQKLAQAKTIQRTLEKLNLEKEKLIAVISRLEQSIQQKMASIQRLKSNSKLRFSPQDLKSSETDYFNHKSKIDTLTSEIYKKQKQQARMQQHSQQLKSTIEYLEKLLSQPKQNKINNQSFIQDRQKIVQKLQEQLRGYQQKLDSMNHQIQKTQIQISKLQQDQSYLNAQIVISQEQETLVLNKIQQLGDIQQNQQQLQELSHSMSINLGIGNKIKKHHFTAKDKLFFSKISSLLERFRIFSRTWQQLQKSHEKLKCLMEMYEKQSQRYMSDLIKRFQAQFNRFFKKIIEKGKTDVRQKKISENIKGMVKFKNCLDIKVSFSEDQQFGRWKQFSGGQKTVLAICVIMALQKCEPAPFYVFDEIDAALSQDYTQKVADIIKEESQNSQYFITSFKKKMLNFDQQIANFYVIQSQNRVSRVTRVDVDQAKRISSEIAH